MAAAKKPRTRVKATHKKKEMVVYSFAENDIDLFRLQLRSMAMIAPSGMQIVTITISKNPSQSHIVSGFCESRAAVSGSHKCISVKVPKPTIRLTNSTRKGTRNDSSIAKQMKAIKQIPAVTSPFIRVLNVLWLDAWPLG